ncbi:asparaginase [Schaalia sp. lx-100]|uniref:asparaginase n=1 Tax=Schaalia sp. lx-100 TaxID=2899081 RepID=UPI001E394078|nr:asparaginase [Schaalia sp. lx-100]MCD4557760.1 asparaginase [Schaalia sp. lx-100]
MKILFLYTGGTIGMRQTSSGLAPAHGIEEWLSKNITGSSVSYTVEYYSRIIDSANINAKDWYGIAAICRTRAQNYDAIIVLHGTDTMAYTSSALSFLLADIDIPVILTGAQLPWSAPQSDALSNVRGALACATSQTDNYAGVSLFFNGHLHFGVRATKRYSESFTGFISPNSVLRAQINTHGEASPIAPTTTVHTNTTSPYISALSAASDVTGRSVSFEDAQHLPDIVPITITPAMNMRRLHEQLLPHNSKVDAPDAVILLAYGAGNGPDTDPDFCRILAGYCDKGGTLVVSSQSPVGGVHLGTYAAGNSLARLGALSGYDATFEALYTKLYVLHVAGFTGTDIRHAMNQSLVGEFSPQEPAATAL